VVYVNQQNQGGQSKKKDSQVNQLKEQMRQELEQKDKAYQAEKREREKFENLKQELEEKLMHAEKSKGNN